MDKTINIKVEALVPTLLEGCKSIVCDNSDYKVHFKFDEEWRNLNVKTGLFVCGGVTYSSVFDGDTCKVPELKDGLVCYIGVVSGDINEQNVEPRKKTSVWCEVEAIPSITSIANEPSAPPKDVYVEFMALLNKYIEQGGGGTGSDSGLTKEEVEEIVAEGTKELSGVTVKGKIVKTFDADTKANQSEFNSLANNVNTNSDDIQLLENRTTNHEERIENLESVLLTFVEDNSTQYEKIVPENAAKHALLNSIGGMSYMSKNLYNPYAPNYSGKTYEVNADGSIHLTSDDIDEYGFITLPHLRFEKEVMHYIYYSADFEAPAVYVAMDSYAEGADLAGGSGTVTPDFYEHGYDGMQVQIEGLTPEEFEEGNVYIMVSTEPITEFEPYGVIRDAKVTDVVSKGAQLIPFPYKDGGVGAIRKANGITWTVNADGSITANGTATGISTFRLADANSFTLPKSRYILSGCPSGGSTASYYLIASTTNNGAWAGEAIDIGVGCVFNLSNSIFTGITVDLAVKAGTVCNNLTFYPMFNYCPSGSTPAPYKTYKSEPVDIFTIPKAIQELEGYGKDGFVLDFDTKTATYNGNTTDLSAYLTYDGYKTIMVEAGGEVVFENERKDAVPSSITYVTAKE